MTSPTGRTTTTCSTRWKHSASDAIEPPAGGPVLDDVDERQKGAFTPKLFGPYFTGNKFGAIAIGGRAEGDEAKSLAREHRIMAQGMLDAWAEVNR